MDNQLAAEKLSDLSERAAGQRKRHYARQPKRAADIVAQLFARKGYGATQTSDKLRQAWTKAAGPALAPHSAAGRLRRGVLEVTVANSLMMQEFGFEKARILKAIRQAMPGVKIDEIRFRVGRIAEANR